MIYVISACGAKKKKMIITGVHMIKHGFSKVQSN